MKTILFWMLRYLGIPAGFMLATGIPQKIYETRNDKPRSQFTVADFKTLEVAPENFSLYFDSLIKSRQQLAQQNKYTAFIYFHDLKQIMMYKEKYHEQYPAPNRFNAGFNDINLKQTDLQMISDNAWREGKLPTDEIKTASEYWLPENHVSKSLDSSFSEDVGVFLNWLLSIYLRGLPFACMLFLIWKFQTRKEFLAPVSFLFSLIIWPIILGVDIRNRFNEFLKKADVISRRNSLFTLFSKQEQQLLEFGKRMTTGEFSEHLDSLNMKRKYSFVNALCVTLFLIIVPASLFPQTNSLVHKEKVIMMKSDYGGGGVHYDVVAKSSAVLNYGEDGKQFTELTKQIFFMPEWLYEYLFIPDIGRIPLVTNRIVLIVI